MHFLAACNRQCFADAFGCFVQHAVHTERRIADQCAALFGIENAFQFTRRAGFAFDDIGNADLHHRGA